MKRELFLIYNNIKRRRSQALITIAIIATTIFVFTLIFGTIQAMKDGLETSEEKLGADLILIPKYSSVENRELLFTASPENVYMKKELLDQLQTVKGISKMTPQFFAQTLALSCCEPGEEARIVGFDPKSDFILGPHLEFEEVAEGKDEIIIGSNFDKELIGNPYLILGRGLKPVNRLLPTGTGMDSTIFINIETLREMSANSMLTEKLWSDKDPEDYISAVLVKLEKGYDIQAFVKEIEDSNLEAKAVQTGETIANLQRQIKTLILLLTILWLASLIITILSLFGRFNALANSRRKEIGLLRALGVKKKAIFLQIIGECSIMAIIGGLIGSICASLAMGTLIDMLKTSFSISPSAWNIEKAIISVIFASLVSLLIGIVSSIYPASKSAKRDPQAAITQGDL